MKTRSDTDIVRGIWNFAKAIGIEAKGDDNMVLNKLKWKKEIKNSN